MLVQDIIRNAASKSGVVPSYNPDEVPQDIMAVGFNLLVTDVLDGLNCDRNLDITTTGRVFNPTYAGDNESVIVLQPLPRSWTGYVAGDLHDDLPPSGTQYVSANLIKLENGTYPYWNAALAELKGSTFMSEPPVNDLGELLPVGMWASDNLFVVGTYAFVNEVATIQNVAVLYSNNHPVNIPFAPMSVSGILEAGSRIDYRYLYLDEFESLDFKFQPFTYTTEERKDYVKIRMRNPGGTKLVILPVPLTIEQTTEDVYGEINAPAKFKSYLTDYLAFLFASQYGLTTKEDMMKLMDQSYNCVKKNHKPKRHEMNTSKQIRNALKRGLNKYWRQDGFI